MHLTHRSSPWLVAAVAACIGFGTVGPAYGASLLEETSTPVIDDRAFDETSQGSIVRRIARPLLATG